MGSTAQGLLTGFICRLCSKMNRYVILIYGEEGQRMKLAEKINSYLPVTINQQDPLPKTACLQCIHKLETHHSLMQMMEKAKKTFQQREKEKACCEKTPELDSDVSTSEFEELACHMPGCSFSPVHSEVNRT